MNTRAQETTIGFWNKNVSLMETYFLTGDLVSAADLKEVVPMWTASTPVVDSDLPLNEIIRKEECLFVLPVTQEIEKNVRNYQLVLARGKAGTSLPKTKDELGFYQGSAGLNIISSIYVDPAKMKSRYATLYISALNGLLQQSSAFPTKDSLAHYLEENYWYTGMTAVHFETSDLVPPLNDTLVIKEIMPHALLHSHPEYLSDLGLPERSDCFADILEIKAKGGKSSMQIFFLSPLNGLVYHEKLPAGDRKTLSFTKAEIHKYGSAKKKGKKGK